MKHALIRLREERLALAEGFRSLGTDQSQEARDYRAQLRREMREVDEAVDFLEEMARFEADRRLTRSAA